MMKVLALRMAEEEAHNYRTSAVARKHGLMMMPL
jgi:hypothetical protein